MVIVSGKLPHRSARRHEYAWSIEQRGALTLQRALTEEDPMSIEALVPLVTYPDAAYDSSVVNATKLAHLLGARLYALALEVRVPDVSNAFAGAILDISKVIKETETASHQRGA